MKCLAWRREPAMTRLNALIRKPHCVYTQIRIELQKLKKHSRRWIKCSSVWATQKRRRFMMKEVLKRSQGHNRGSISSMVKRITMMEGMTSSICFSEAALGSLTVDNKDPNSRDNTNSNSKEMQAASSSQLKQTQDRCCCISLDHYSWSWFSVCFWTSPQAAALRALRKAPMFHTASPTNQVPSIQSQ